MLNGGWTRISITSSCRTTRLTSRIISPCAAPAAGSLLSARRSPDWCAVCRITPRQIDSARTLRAPARAAASIRACWHGRRCWRCRCRSVARLRPSDSRVRDRLLQPLPPWRTRSSAITSAHFGTLTCLTYDRPISTPSSPGSWASWISLRRWTISRRWAFRSLGAGSTTWRAGLSPRSFISDGCIPSPCTSGQRWIGRPRATHERFGDFRCAIGFGTACRSGPSPTSNADELGEFVRALQP